MEKDVKTLKIVLIIILSLIIIVFGIFIYLLFFRTINCQINDEECFSKSIINCERALFIRDGDDFTTSYSIKGNSNGGCEVTVNILQVKKGSNELSVLEGKSMDCIIPIGLDIKNPESEIKNCNGLLKEEIQNIIIQKMHSQLIENIYQIREDATKVL